MSETTVRCGMYARVKGSGSGDIAWQKNVCHELAAAEGMTVLPGYMYIEDGPFAGRSIDVRPELQRLLAEAEAEPRPFDVLLVEHPKRFSRSISTFLSIYSRLSRLGVEVRAVHRDEVQISSTATTPRSLSSNRLSSPECGDGPRLIGPATRENKLSTGQQPQIYLKDTEDVCRQQQQ